MRCEGSTVKRRKFSIQHLRPNYQEKALSRFDTQSYMLVFPNVIYTEINVLTVKIINDLYEQNVFSNITCWL